MTSTPNLTELFARPDMPFTAFSDLPASYPAYQPWIIQNLLPIGLTLLSGDPRSGKSSLALQLMLDIATATPPFAPSIPPSTPPPIPTSMTRTPNPPTPISMNPNPPAPLHMTPISNLPTLLHPKPRSLTIHQPPPILKPLTIPQPHSFLFLKPLTTSQPPPANGIAHNQPLPHPYPANPHGGHSSLNPAYQQHRSPTI